MVKTALNNVPFTLSKLLAASILDMDYAASIFSFIQNPNLFMFNTMLRGYSISNFPNKALPILNELRNRGIVLDQFSFITVLKACGRISEVGLAKGSMGLQRIEDAHKLFDEFSEGNDLVSWNTLMGGCVLVSQPNLVFDLFWKMCWSGLKASVATVLSLMSASGDIGNFVVGESLHGNYARNGLVGEAVALLQQMRLQGVKPNSSTMVGLLSTCPASGSIQVVRYITSFIEEEKLELDVVLGTALVDMYAKCGFLDEAMDIFERIEDKDVKSWTAMISGHGVHGQPTNAIRLFNRMENEGFKPNEVTFLAILTACSHGGLVIEGMDIFKRMVQEYGFSPRVEHYGCLVDLLGRAGMLHEAHKLIKSLPIKGDATAWRTLLLLAEYMEMLNWGSV
ncbi:Tetratricopeptide-like helical domain superfamily [Sesbania bispinosa]|nr:Tetratricopeptide-like helical domain superfamily [Sesbania bispinosa]